MARVGSGDGKPRNLVLLFDGTWNVRTSFTNVARMFEAIDDSQPEDCGDRTVQVVKYFKGVGTNPIGHILGGAVGWGLSDIVKEGYCWLSNKYRKGDKIFVFGFSRGAFSARSLVSLVHRCGGVLTRGEDGKDLEVTSPILLDAYSMYQSYVVKTDKDGKDKNDPDLEDTFEKKWNHFDTRYSGRVLGPVKVTMLGVWDTVGALGIPDGLLNFNLRGSTFFQYRILSPIAKLASVVDDVCKISRKHFAFHDQELPPIVENAYHALAIDEHREDFKPTLWVDHREPEDKGVKHQVKQVWFVGSHSNVGGGARTGDDDEDPDDLWQYSYIWMQANAITNGLRFYFHHSPGEQWPSTSRKLRYVSKTDLDDSFGNMGFHFKIPLWNPLAFLRTFVPVPSLENLLKVVPFRNPFASYESKMGKLSLKIDLFKYSWLNREHHRTVDLTNGAKLHWSVVERLRQDTSYRPMNLTIVEHAKVQYTKRLDGTPWYERERPDPLYEWCDWPVEDEALEHQYERPCGLKINTEKCPCKENIP